MLSNTTIHIYEYITRHPCVFTSDIAKYSGLQMKNVNYHVRILRKQGMIYVSSWIEDHRKIPIMALSAGNKIDAEKPPLKPQAIMRHEKKLMEQREFKPRPDEAAAWLMNPITPKNTDMSAR